LPLYYQQLILDAENKNMEKGIKWKVPEIYI
jgi:hypothetical protein